MVITMRIVVLREPARTERRVALTAEGTARLLKVGHTVMVESKAGVRAGIPDGAYEDAGANIGQGAELLDQTATVLAINGSAAHRIDGLNKHHTLLALLDPLWKPQHVEALAKNGPTLISLELIPRVTRAQTMDVLSSMATVAGSEAVLLAARTLPKMFPLMMTAAGTVAPARVLVLGAGVAGLQAIATAKRLGAVVEGYDVRPAAAEQIRSLGAKAVELDLATEDSQDSGGYAKEQDAETASRQLELLAHHVGQADVVITTAAIPGAASPLLVTTSMVESMAPGSVIVDMAGERGGNCELSVLDEEVNHQGVIILSPSDLASGSAATASQMFSHNVVSFLEHLTGEDGNIKLDLEDELTVGTLVARDGVIVHPRILEKLA